MTEILIKTLQRGAIMIRDGEPVAAAKSIDELMSPPRTVIDWNHLHPDYQFLAMDKNGEWFAYKSLPSQICEAWEGLGIKNLRGFASFDPDAFTGDWTQSLMERPQ